MDCLQAVSGTPLPTVALKFCMCSRFVTQVDACMLAGCMGCEIADDAREKNEVTHHATNRCFGRGSRDVFVC